MESAFTAKLSRIFFSKRSLIYLSGFLFAFHIAIPTYIYSSFLGGIVSASAVGSIYAVASLLTIIFNFSAPSFLRKIGNYRTIMLVLSIELLSLIGMAYFNSPALIVFFFIINFTAIAIASFNFDIFLEGISSNESTGGIRGSYLTFANTAWVLSPLVAGYILIENNYWSVLVLSGIFIIPVFLLIKYGFENFKDCTHESIPILKTVGRVLSERDITKSFALSFMLQFFYSWMVIYTPVYLFSKIGFSWSEIGIMFSIMLLPFVFIEYPLGKLADKYFGEKEIMSLGFVLIAISTGLIYFLDTPNFILWTIVLFMTRVGASIVEIMSETYFFKITDSKDMPVISLFRAMRPLAYVIGPLLATAALALTDLRLLFPILGIIMILGLRFSLTIHDTK
ncbi:MAG: MFS transporter [Candidatus Paceibacterota bacterium]|jgi:MFS family permease